MGTESKLTEKPTGGLRSTTEGGIFHINRCESCGTLLTKLEILARLDAVHSGQEWRGLCSCGASRFKPSYPLWHEWFRPRVIRMALAVLRGEVEPGESR